MGPLILRISGTTGYDLHLDTHDPGAALSRLWTAGSLSISPELFEKIYLSPKNWVSNNIRSTFGNATPRCGYLPSERSPLLTGSKVRSVFSFCFCLPYPTFSLAGEYLVVKAQLKCRLRSSSRQYQDHLYLPNPLICTPIAFAMLRVRVFRFSWY
jgi:hypothetical protein